ncbi:hypothetical protein [Rahnella sp. PCH160]|uniref:hypothetical protein n=1 Tax=Rahnella sp. PCH160 TaxID=3447928 RepID=UPI0039FDB1E3
MNNGRVIDPEGSTFRGKLKYFLSIARKAQAIKSPLIQGLDHYFTTVLLKDQKEPLNNLTNKQA